MRTSPDAVRAWWCEVPREWIVGRDGDALLLATRFGGVRVRERFVVDANGWRFETRAPLGLDVLDAFEPAPHREGTLLAIDCELRGRNALGRALVPLYAPWAKRQFRRRWLALARACEADSGAPNP